MNTSQILRALKYHPATRDKFIGVFAANQLPTIVKKPCCFVVNTDVDTGPGQHWVAFYFDVDVADYFDSYGLPPALFEKYLKLNATYLNISNVQLQGFMSSVCGQYCIYFLLYRCLEVPMERIVKMSTNKFINDAFVCEFVNVQCNIHTDVFEDDVVVNQLCTAFDVNKL